jgi:hypothetical protein
MRFRFSLRALLVLTACLAAVAYYRDRPRQLADRFVRAVAARDFELANATCNRELPIFGLELKYGRRPITAVREPQSVADWLAGRCLVTVTFGNPPVFVTDSGTLTFTAHGVPTRSVVLFHSPKRFLFLDEPFRRATALPRVAGSP